MSPSRLLPTLAIGLLLAALGPPAGAGDLPPIPDLTGKVLTVRGPVNPAALGPALMHEHVFIDFKAPRSQRPEAATDVELSLQPLRLDNLAAVRAGHWCADNDFLGSFDDALGETMAYKKLGGGTIVEQSCILLGRDPIALFKLSNATDLHIVMGAGWYHKAYHPPGFAATTVEEMTEVMVRDVVEGVGGTGIRAGILGEIGINGRPLIDIELRMVRATARAARLTGAPISFHVGGVGEEKFTVLGIVAEEGVDLARVVMSHSNGMALDLEFGRRVLATGVTIEFDWLGAPGGPGGFLGSYTDRDIAVGIAQLVREGYARQIVLGHDTCNKLQLRKYGGLGYTYIHEYFLPALRELGVSEADIHTMMVENPARILAFAAPQKLVAR